MARQAAARRKHQYSINSTVLEDDLLNENERALYELDQSFIQDVTSAQEGLNSRRNHGAAQLRHGLRRCCCCLDRGLLSLAAMLVITLVGIGILAGWRDSGSSVNRFGHYVLSAGVFGLASGGTNWLAVIGLFYKIPGFIGSGVFYRQHRQIRNVVKLIVLQMVFDSRNLEAYLTRKITQFSSSVQVADSITAALGSPEVERIVEERLEVLYVQPEGQYLEALGLSKVRLRPLVKPAVLSLYAEAAPLVLDTMTEKRGDQAISVPQFREEMDRYLSWRAEAVTERDIGKLMRKHLNRPFSWIVVWGSVFGLLTGIVVQALHISPSFNITRQ